MNHLERGSHRYGAGQVNSGSVLFDLAKPIVIAPIDDFLLLGPKGGLEDRSAAISVRLVTARPDAILTFPGTVSHYPDLLSRIPRIINLSVSTSRVRHTRKESLAGIEAALRLDASAVAFHINLLSDESNRMLAAASSMIELAERYQLPTIGIIYPRGENGELDENYDLMRAQDAEGYTDLVAHCVAVGADLGFDAVKTQYTGSIASFERVILAAGRMPVLVAWWPPRLE